MEQLLELIKSRGPRALAIWIVLSVVIILGMDWAGRALDGTEKVGAVIVSGLIVTVVESLVSRSR